jgi:hypothetical protein
MLCGSLRAPTTSFSREGVCFLSEGVAGPPVETVSVTVGPDYRIFVLFSALNHYGYDLEGESAMGPVRLAVRRLLALAEKPGPAGAGPAAKAAAETEAGRQWMEWLRPFYPRVGLMEVYALHQRDWPGDGPGPFGPGESGPFLAWLESNRLELPAAVPGGFIAWLTGLGRLMDGFAGRMGLAALWEQHLQPQLDQGGRVAAAVRGQLGRAAALLALPSWPFSSVRVITNPLQSRWLADQALVGPSLNAVIAAPDLALVSSVVHEALHLAVRPALLELWPYLEDWSHQASCEAIRGTMEPRGYWGATPVQGLYRAVQEAVVRAATVAALATSAGDLASRARAEADQGFELVPPLAESLATRARIPLTAPELAGVLAMARAPASSDAG